MKKLFGYKVLGLIFPISIFIMLTGISFIAFQEPTTDYECNQGAFTEGKSHVDKICTLGPEFAKVNIKSYFLKPGENKTVESALLVRNLSTGILEERIVSIFTQVLPAKETSRYNLNSITYPVLVKIPQLGINYDSRKQICCYVKYEFNKTVYYLTSWQERINQDGYEFYYDLGNQGLVKFANKSLAQKIQNDISISLNKIYFLSFNFNEYLTVRLNTVERGLGCDKNALFIKPKGFTNFYKVAEIEGSPCQINVEMKSIQLKYLVNP